MQLWDIEQATDLLVKGRFQRDENGHEVWVLTAKRQWSLNEKVWDEVPAEEIYDDPIYLGEPGLSAMKVDHEFPVSKQNTDVLVYGKARAYAKRPVTYHECRILIDNHIDKSIAVHGERQWVQHGGSVTVSHPKAYVEAEIDHSRALGGDERNRVGSGIAKSSEELLAKPVPSVFFPNEEWAPNTKPLRVAGLGPIPPFFSERTRYAGTFDEHWEEHRRPLLPEDFDRKFYQSAPADQQCDGFLEGGERLMMSGFSHDDVFSFRIPSEKFVAIADFGDEKLSAPMPMYTVFIDTEEKRLTISYTASFPCQAKEHLLVSSTVSKARESA
ncbi:DUF2169 family type VI secretion system accessory protein [Vibrio coralliilyticus]|uniref:DUF2169 family type VI secretion system accessory protein n=1 Tax=Vibrio coralliilyticus TaxID=190893 RepID=UPI00148C3066|nr:DUF2169 domain-containing protein [Vibrio coralliilyticus]NOI29632.1 DUF2169 domain-containing protein [Vibrio coralliilyticus]NOI48710.1 DUF2169 domain-containing protein [Vibrio coralliilyticus]